MNSLKRLGTLTLLAGLGFGLPTQVYAITTAIPSSLDSSNETILWDVELGSGDMNQALLINSISIVNPSIGKWIVVGARGSSPTRPPPKGPPVVRHPLPGGGGKPPPGGVGGTPPPGGVGVGSTGTPLAVPPGTPTGTPGPRLKRWLGQQSGVSSGGSPGQSASGSAISLSPPKTSGTGGNNLLTVPPSSNPPTKKDSWPRQGGNRS